VPGHRLTTSEPFVRIGAMKTSRRNARPPDYFFGRSSSHGLDHAYTSHHGVRRSICGRSRPRRLRLPGGIPCLACLADVCGLRPPSERT
jgi:hypothetical protein